MYKQVILLRTDLRMGRGKAIAQCCHASLGAVEMAGKDVVRRWEEEGAKKVVLSTTLVELRSILRKLRSSDLPYFLVRNRGKTQLKPGTPTCLAIGPAEESKVDELTAGLRLL